MRKHATSRRGGTINGWVSRWQPFLLALSPYSWYLLELRYLLLASVVLALILARLLVQWALGVLGLVAEVLLTVRGIRAIPVNLPYPANFQPLVVASTPEPPTLSRPVFSRPL